jgi:tyrosine-protein kinase Etk/Wzc
VEEINEDQHTLEDSWRVVWRRKWMVLLIVSVATSAVLVGSFLMTPVYEASAMLRIKEQKPSVLGADNTGSGISLLISKDEINTQIEILKSRSVLEEVIVKLDLAGNYKLEKKLTPEERLLTSLNRLRKDLSVSNIANTQLIRIAIRSRDPVMASDAVNSLSQIFIGRNVEVKRGEANAVLAFVSEQADLVSEKLKRTEEDLLAYKQSARVGDLSEEAKQKVDRLAAIEGLYQEATVAREILDVRIRALLGQMSPAATQDGSLAGISSAPAIRGIQYQLADLQTQLTGLETGSSSDSPKAVDIKARIDHLKKEIQLEIEKILNSGGATSVNKALQMQLADYQAQDIVLAAQEDAWVRQIKFHEEDINKLSSREIDLTRLERAQRINEELYSSLMRAKNEAGIEAASQIGNIDVVDPAVTPVKPVLPKKAENAVIAFAGSLFLALILSFIIEYLDKTLKTEDEMKRLLGIPILGIIPRFEVNRRRNGKKSRRITKDDLPLVTRDEPASAASEGFRLLRANLRFVELDRELKTIMVTSPTPGDGKTTIAANLSIELAAQEQRVLVVDADFRIPALHKIFNLPDSPGISNVLSEGRAYQTVIQKIEGVDNLDVMTVGPLPPNSSELLGSSRMRQLIEELKVEYTRIILDVPPVLATTDALDLAGSLDGVLLVLKMGETDKRAIKRMMDIFHNTRIRILGGVLNGVDARQGRFRYSQYYYHYGAGQR